jgi:flagellar motor protein MotB
MRPIFRHKSDEEHNFWMSYTDLMSAFLIVFILITAVLFVIYRTEHNRLKELAKELDDATLDNAHLLDWIEDFKKNDLRNVVDQYEEVLLPTETINVKTDKEVGSIILTHNQYDLFEKGKWTVSGDLGNYLRQYGPALVRKTIQISSEINRAVELRIEGHTDPTWGDYGYLRGTDISFLENLELSSKRANSVYDSLFNLKDSDGYSIWNESEKDFIRKNMISVGYSFSRRLIDNNVDDTSLDDESRRIEFRIIAK